MSHSNCPICYTKLGVCEVTPCLVCGGWDGILEALDADSEFTEYYLESGNYIILCSHCWLEEMLCLQGSLVSDLNLPISGGLASGYTISNRAVEKEIVKDKYCSNCNKRYALLKIVKNIENNS